MKFAEKMLHAQVVHKQMMEDLCDFVLEVYQDDERMQDMIDDCYYDDYDHSVELEVSSYHFEMNQYQASKILKLGFKKVIVRFPDDVKIRFQPGDINGKK